MFTRDRVNGCDDLVRLGPARTIDGRRASHPDLRFGQHDPVHWDRVLWAAYALRAHGMPQGEVHSLLATDDPRLIRRHMDLHRERLEERFADHRELVDTIEGLLLEAAGLEAGIGRDRSTRPLGMDRNRAVPSND
jgi:hypothetical protein